MEKILLTGGHAGTTAMAVVEEILRRRKGNIDIYWIGVKTAFEGYSVRSLESEYLLKLNVKSYFIQAGRLQRKFTLWTVPALLKIPVGFLQSLLLILKIKPNVVLSFGGFASFPVVFWSRVLGIPVVVHEQTAVAGRANLVNAWFANKIAVSRKNSLSYFPLSKTVLTGNPIMTQIWEVPVKDKKSNLTTVYITGGSRGSIAINDAVLEALDSLLEKYYLIHQTGQLDFERVKAAWSRLDRFYRERYEVYPVIDPMQIDGVYRRADIVVSRAGANTVSEIIVVKRPAVLIPLPFSYLNEQSENAKLAVKYGIAIILPQDKLTGFSLKKKIDYLDRNWSFFVNRVKNKESPDKNAASALFNLLESFSRKR